METATSVFNQALGFVDPVLAFLRDGYNSLNANPVLALLIAVGAVILLKKWGQVFIIAIGAVLIHQIVNILIPVVQGGQFRFPALMEAPFWQEAAGLYVGYLIIISVLFFLKRIFIRGGAAAGAKAH